ncbi:uncharacterized protein LOC132616912 [Lycium barbarum]|uniref:uncharacterized protein LOC132616912 n=1 Tax=Lycium barbarum TaxID=112863 RepID=UPI00293E21A6|nr:uncharacterized protein LOC132616912 [Lycium barbarum]
MEIDTYQSTWNIIGEDVSNVIKSFFNGAPVPKFFTHTCLIMLPKVDSLQSFADMRSISLCNVSAKIISKLLNSKLSTILPRIISQNQSGFVKGRAITENIFLTQQIFNDIGKQVPRDNIVIKLDMSKAYDKVSWNFLCLMLRKMGNAIIQLILSTSATYEQVSRQQINTTKCSFSMAASANVWTISRIKRLTDIRYEELIIKYLGCPIYSGRKKNEIFSDLVTKVVNKIKGWHLKLLSTGGRAILIKHILIALNIHTLVVVHPTKGTLEAIEK